MIDLKIKYSDKITILESQEKTFMMRLWIVMNEEGILVRDFINNTITADGLIPLDKIKEIINEQFNPDYINIVIL